MFWVAPSEVPIARRRKNEPQWRRTLRRVSQPLCRPRVVTRLACGVAFAAAIAVAALDASRSVSAIPTRPEAISVSIAATPGTPLDLGAPDWVQVQFVQGGDFVRICTVSAWSLAAYSYFTFEGAADVGPGPRSPTLTVTGGSPAAFADPSLILPAGNVVNSDQAYIPRVDMDDVEWTYLPVNADDGFETNMPNAVIFDPDATLTAEHPELAAHGYFATCVIVHSEPTERHGLASSSFVYRWGDQNATTWDGDAGQSRVYFSYEEAGDERITSVVPEPAGRGSHEWRSEFAFNSFFDAQVTYESTGLHALVVLCRWVATILGGAALVDFYRFAISRRRVAAGRA